MAIVKRESGSWKKVIKNLKEAGITVKNKDDLSRILHNEQVKYDDLVREFDQKQQEAAQRCKDEIAQIFTEQECRLSLIIKKFKRKICPVQDRIYALEKQREELGEKSVFYKLFHILEIIKFTIELKKTSLKFRRITSEKDVYLKEQNNFFDRKRLEATHRRDDVIYELKKEIGGEKRRVRAIEETLKSNDYYGAVAELKMIDLLRKLPDSYYVINDVCIKLTKSIRFNDEWISSVQIDHLVIGPSGVFIVEVKNLPLQVIFMTRIIKSKDIIVHVIYYLENKSRQN